jgi:hypothetical protein
MGLCALEISKAEGWPYAVRLASFIGDSDLVVRISSVGDADLDPVLGSNRSLVNKAAIGRSLLGPGILDSYPFCRRRSPLSVIQAIFKCSKKSNLPVRRKSNLGSRMKLQQIQRIPFDQEIENGLRFLTSCVWNTSIINWNIAF